MLPRVLPLCLVAVLALAGCAPRGVITLMPQAAEVAATRTVFVGTTRAPEAGPDGFGADRSRTTSFGRYAIAIPPDREPGGVTWPHPGRTPDPTRAFLTVAAEPFADAAAFRRALRGALAEKPAGHRDAMVYIHGYNNRYAEGIYRLAQLAHDFDLPGVAVHYAWPSAGKPLVYAYDRDSALYARDGLESLLAEITAARPDRIVLVAHSLGSAVTMETLRQLAIGRRRDVLSRIGGVVLISPDLDIDVFRAQARRIGELPQPFFIFTSRRDRALAVSALLAGESERLGSVSDVADLAEFEVTVLDVSAFSTGLGHFALGDSPALIRLLSVLGDVSAAFNRDPWARPGLLSGTILTVRRATQIILKPIETLADTTG